MSKSKKKFEVQESETISECLKRMEKEGYQPIRRMEEPVFREVNENGRVQQKVHRQKVVFEGKLRQNTNN